MIKKILLAVPSAMLCGPSSADFVGVAGCEGGSAELVGKRGALCPSKCRFRGRCGTLGMTKCRCCGSGNW